MEGRILYTPRDYKKPVKKDFSQKKIWFWAIFFGLAIIITGSVYLLNLSYWQIKKVEIKGLVVLDSAEVKSKIDNFISGQRFSLLPQSSYPLFNSNELALLLKQGFPRLEQVVVNKIFPDALEVNFKERELFGVFCSSPQIFQEETGDSQCVYIDKNGLAYEPAPVSSGSLLLKVKSDAGEVGVGSLVLEKSLLDDVIFLAGELEKIIGLKPAVFEILSKVSSEIKVETNEGFKIIFKRGGDFETSFRALKTILEQEIKDKRSQLEYIDLRFGNKVFYRFKK